MKASWFLVTLSVLFYTTTVDGQIGEGISTNDRAYFKSLAENILSDVQSSSGRVNSAAHLLKILQPDAKNPNQKETCSNAEKQLLNAGANVKNAFYSLNTMHTLECSNSKVVPETTRETMKSLLTKDSLEELHYAILLDIESFGGKNMDIESIVSTIADVHDRESGMFSNNPEGEISLKSTATALKLIASLLPFATDSTQQTLKQMASSASVLLPSSPEDDLADATLIHDLVKTVSNLKVKPKQMRMIVADLVSMKFTPCICTALKVYKAFLAVSKLAKAPLVLSLNEPALVYSSSGVNILVTLSDILGSNLNSDHEVAITNLVSDEGISNDQRQPFSSAGAGIYSISMVLEPAAYLLDIEVTPGSGNPIKFRKRMVVTIPATISNVVSTISESRHAVEGEEYEGQFPRGAEASAFEGHWLHFSFDVMDVQGQAFTPHQAFVRLHHLDSDLDTYFIAAPNSKGRLNAAVSLSDESSTLLNRSGIYSVTILVGDSVLSEAQETSLGQIKLTIIPEKKKDLPLYKRSLLYDSDTTLEALPEKFHTFREPDQRAHTFVSLVFTGTIFGTLLVLIAGIFRAGGNIQNLTNLSGASFIWAAGFQSCIGAILLLFITYWLDLTMISCLTYLIPLALGTLFIGHRALCNLAGLRESANSK